MVVICSLISPYQSDRARVREICHRDGIPFAEVFINAPLQVCEQRDPRGLYKKARAGEIADFTGISSPYEPPTKPELEILTSESTMEASLGQLLDFANAFARKLESSPATEQTAGSGI
jgi:adenylylsulfate kinase-like enzyme